MAAGDFQNEWQTFFDRHAPHYSKNAFAQFTLEEVDFFLALTPLPDRATILDVGCGIGRHSIELAKRGFQMTAVDISPGMLTEAGKAAQAEGVKVDFVCADATAFVTAEPQDAAICLCEGAFNLVSMAEDPVTHDLAILTNVARSLKPGAPFLLNTLNAFALIRSLTDEAISKGAFDPLTMIGVGQDVWDLPEGRQTVTVKERRYTPPEMQALLSRAGFDLVALFGGTAGEWARRPLKLDEIEALYFCKRKGA